MDSSLAKVLIVDDDENICEVIKLYLESSGYATKISNDGKSAQNVFVEYKPDIVLLDIMLPQEDGIDVLKWIRKADNTPVIMLTAKGETFDKVLTLELGADDYIVKPFEPKELVARVKAVLRRANSENVSSQVLNFNGLKIDMGSYTVIYNEKDIKMPPKEFELLYYLANNKNKVFTREQLLCEVWGYDYPGDSRTVDVHVKRLREKLHEGNGWDIQTVWGVGYKFEVK
ncbi:DNA-binding response OmpR family regulator [Clostridium acetobutylicum]|uniref:Stage 0 sporulation protein A homolog n=1 Tax=Clostridium acetobutylicum (strain ATCC 824 / DSM 792 / JCM 1419 / IAM 19013 / LMG 5710 / NBRC 13948 / NRRL B-527 / VKM B-1787 / 2291 / W) TaxID=272562 RepID=Q97E94_CLOAB|nr:MULTISPECIES: response regulator transcription factor [Clostridium]AAK81156.1 Response regulator (CheY-like receiver domain and HTH-type DNA-binding domain) [Clostridium acetobutylicum ATCC 824]ADZ22261.1 Response regulator (CheY-like receiver domain and HTH-type DNA-binding domain) [Clostridium acetobutylicum EA 2018]AEI32717.1 response regulator [Clostridium acetobutylicum DSM 1731]AWV81176.1 DNA-binding response regulator [Clostridium acetobutylicum]KHD35250.1 transcriptional regulator [